MAFTNDKTETSSFSDDSVLYNNSNFAVEQYTKYVAKDYTADNTLQYYGNANDFGLMYDSVSDKLKIISNDNNLIEISKDGTFIMTANTGPGVDVFKVQDSAGNAIFAVNSDGMEIEAHFQIGSDIAMTANDALPGEEFESAHGFTFYDSEAYAKVGE